MTPNEQSWWRSEVSSDFYHLVRANRRPVEQTADSPYPVGYPFYQSLGVPTEYSQFCIGAGMELRRFLRRSVEIPRLGWIPPCLYQRLPVRAIMDGTSLAWRLRAELGKEYVALSQVGSASHTLTAYHTRPVGYVFYAMRYDSFSEFNPPVRWRPT